MATLVLSAAGMALGGSIGGTVAGLSMAVIGRTAGAAIGQSIDQKLLGSGSQAVQTGRIDRFRLTGANQGAAMGQVFGRMRIGGHVIWATRFLEHAAQSGGSGKGSSSAPSVTRYSYSVSLAIALCEGEITHVGRIWADGVEVPRDTLNMRVYPGSASQLPDPKIVAVQGAKAAPAFRGTAYVVFEDLDLSPYGNRVPQFNFEVTRPSEDRSAAMAQDISHAVTAVAMMPGSGEFSLATTPVYFDDGAGKTRAVNVNTATGGTDFEVSLEALVGELPNCQSTSLIVSWFGNDLRVGHCELRPKVEQSDQEPEGLTWQVSGVTRATAQKVPYVDGRPAYGGTPSDQSVMEAIAALRSKGQEVLFYPFILMDQLSGNGRPDPWSAAPDQPAFPWRGRITTDKAPGQPGSVDNTAAADAQVAQFFGQAKPSDFTISGGQVHYSGPAEWSFRRFILHNAALCKAAGGVEAFCIGSEMRSMTQIRGAGGRFVAVQALRVLAADVRQLLGAHTKLSYAADWSEYFGYQPNDGSNDRYFHLDPLWADANIDFIGIDNYMPLSDWRDGDDHADAGWGSIYNLDYLSLNVEGGEGYDWYYHSPEARAAQIRTPITDGAGAEPWIYRYKDIRNWWKNPHYERKAGQRDLLPTDWVPQSKPIWFTEIGCGAVDKGTNEPNKFVDPKSSESALPRYSNGRRDELIQMQYLRVIYSYWNDPQNNPQSVEYDGQMLDMSRAHVWAWDARPYPAFPGYRDLWSDGDNYDKGHWITGRTAARPLDSVVREICARAGLADVETTELYGYLRGYGIHHVDTARAALQPLMLAFGFDVMERAGKLVFRSRSEHRPAQLDMGALVMAQDSGTAIDYDRAAAAEISDRVRLNYVEADGDFEIAASEAVFPENETRDISTSELNIALKREEARAIVERWLIEARVGRDRASFSLPPSLGHLGAGDVVKLAEPGGLASYRIDQFEQGDQGLAQAVRVDETLYQGSSIAQKPLELAATTPITPVFPLFMDLPLITGDELPHAPYVAATAEPWPGPVALYSSRYDADFALNTVLQSPAVLGVTATPLAAATPGILDHGAPLEVELTRGSLSGVTLEALLAGANLAAIGDGSPDNWEIFQFQSADLMASGRYELSGRLRGQLGSDALMPAYWPAGSYFVLLDGAPQQIELAASGRNILQYFQIGPAARPYSDYSYRKLSAAFAGNGLRPYAPVHLDQKWDGTDVEFSWIRRARLDGASWDLAEIPLQETTERYQVKIFSGAQLLRQEEVSQAQWRYSAAMRSADGAHGLLELQVAQLSESFGPGLFRKLRFTA